MRLRSSPRARASSLIGMDDLEDATIKVISRSAEERQQGHQREGKAPHGIPRGGSRDRDRRLLQPDTPVHQISIIPSRHARAAIRSAPPEGGSLLSVRRPTCENEIVTLLGGRCAAEALILGDISTGASATTFRGRHRHRPRSMVTKYGMSDLARPDRLTASEHNSERGVPRPRLQYDEKLLGGYRDAHRQRDQASRRDRVQHRGQDPSRTISTSCISSPPSS